MGEPKHFQTWTLGEWPALQGALPVGESLAGARVGRIQVGEVLGRGGMGEVYAGYDERLERPVAIKRIALARTWSTEARERFLLEARMLSRIDHPGVCRVFDLVEQDGVDLLVMELVAGAPPRGPLPRAEVWRMGVQIFEALAAAHQTGVIHRDIKPDNVLVDDQGQVKILDFSIATLVDGPMGSTAGTPRYMSPEQAAGEALSPTTDVYSAALLLAELLWAEAPELTGSSTVDSLPAGRWPPDEVDPVLRPLLVRDPSRRPDALAARDLLLAQLAAPSRRRRRGLAALAAVVAVALLGWGAAASMQRQEAEQAALLGQQLEDELDAIGHIIDGAFTAPPHDVRAELASARERVERLDDLGGKRPVGLAALGRARLLVHDEAGALEALQAAWDAGVQTPQVALALGLSRSESYNRSYRHAMGAPKGADRDQRLAAARAEVEAAFAEIGEVAARSQSSAPELLEARLAIIEGRHDDALARLDAAEARTPWDYEIRLQRAEVYEQQALGLVFDGQFAEGLARYRAAEGALRRTLEVARSDPRVHLRLCQVWGAMATTTTEGNLGDVEPLLEGADADCGAAAAVYPGYPGLGTAWAETWTRVGEQRLHLDGEPEQALERALSLIREDAEAPRTSRSLNRLGTTLGTLAKFRANRNEDPTALLDEALAVYEEAVDLDPAAGRTYANLLYALAVYTLWDFGHGGDAVGKAALAAEWMARAEAHTDQGPGRYRNLAWIQAIAGRSALFRGEDPTALLEASLASADRQLAAAPGEGTTLGFQSSALISLAEHRLATGQPAGALLERAEAVTQEALGGDDELHWLHANLGRIDTLRGRWAEAEAHYARYRAHSSQQASASTYEATHYLRRALSGGSPQPALGRAEAALVRLDEADRSGMILLLLGRVRQLQGRPAEAAALGERALELNANLVGWRLWGIDPPVPVAPLAGPLR